jgi:hypothetical protein
MTMTRNNTFILFLPSFVYATYLLDETTMAIHPHDP